MATANRIKRYLAWISLILSSAALTVPAFAKECYAPDKRAQERAFSRAVITEGGRTIWLKECFPGSALITVTGFARPSVMVEVQGIAVVGGK